MAKQAIGIGSAPNDGTGDTLRVAFDKVNDNFDEVYSAFTTFASNNATFANNLLTGNSTVNAIINSVSIIFSGNVTINSTVFKVGNSTVNAVVNSSVVAVGANVSLTNGLLSIGNSTVNTVINSISTKIAAVITANTTGVFVGANASLLTGSLFIGNSTVNAVVNSSTLTLGNTTITSGRLFVGNSTVNAIVNSSIIRMSNSFIVNSSSITLDGGSVAGFQRITGGGAGYTSGHIQLDALAGSSSGSSGMGIYYHDPDNSVEWYTGRSYGVNDRFIVSRLSTASHDGSTATWSYALLTVLGTGNVGIGNNAPDTKLHVQGNVHAHGLRIDITPSANVVADSTHTIPINLNGTTYHVLVAS